MLGPVGSNSEGAGASREGFPAHAQQSRGAGFLQLSIQVPGQSVGSRPPCHPAGEGVPFVLPKCLLSPGLTVNFWRQFPPTWNTAGGSREGWGRSNWSETSRRSNYKEAADQEQEHLDSLTRNWLHRE